ncbi:nucleotidyltransferase [Candidatus Woesearchaeota archaeon]|nr:nucleotidyltransferase [Candidatus Woesearchaeota archaeon]
MTDLKVQEDIFNLIGSSLKKKLKCYVIGGSAMLYYKLKEVTKDIDIVLLTENDRDYALKAMKELGYAERSSKMLYVNKKNVPILLQRGQDRFDLFNRKIINLKFTDAMAERARLVLEYGSLTANIISPEDIIILKCATDRAGDRLDAAGIIKNTNINFDILLEESINQMKMVGDVIPLNLYQFLLELKEDMNIEIPDGIIKKLEDECEKILDEKLKKGSTVKVTKYKKTKKT